MRTLALVVLLCLWFGVANSAKAESTPAVASTTHFNWCNTLYGDQPGASCSGSGGSWSAINTVVTNRYLALNYGGGLFTCETWRPEPSGTPYDGGCYGTRYDGVKFWVNPGGMTKKSALLECPANQNWTLSGSTCTRPDCSAGQTRGADGVCVVTCPAAGSNAMIGGAKAYGITGTSAACVSGVVFASCAIKCTSGVSAGGKASCTGCTFTGSNNLSGDTASPIGDADIKDATVTPSECLAQGKGYITTSGGTTCVASADSPNPVKSTEVSKTETTGTGAGTSETTTECEGGNCTSTTTNKDGTGAVIGTTTETGTDPAAKEKDPETDCDKFPNSAGCLELGAPPTGDEVGTKAIDSAITPVSMGSSACPSDVNLPKGAKFSWAPVCEFATDLRPVIIALAWLAAAFIVLGFSRGN